MGNQGEKPRVGLSNICLSMVLLYHFWQYRAYFSVRYCLITSYFFTIPSSFGSILGKEEVIGNSEEVKVARRAARECIGTETLGSEAEHRRRRKPEKKEHLRRIGPNGFSIGRAHEMQKPVVFGTAPIPKATGFFSAFHIDNNPRKTALCRFRPVQETKQHRLQRTVKAHDFSTPTAAMMVPSRIP